MKVLAFDCSAPRGSVAAIDGGTVVFAREFTSARGRCEGFFTALNAAFAAAGPPDRIAVGLGPGSYNGLRVAAAAAEGLRIATGAALVGIASVRALPCAGNEYAAISDARGGVFYFVHVRDRVIDGEIELLPLDALERRLGEFPGIEILAPAPVNGIPGVRVAAPDAAILARLALDEEPAAGVLEPLYLKPPHVTQPRA